MSGMNELIEGMQIDLLEKSPLLSAELAEFPWALSIMHCSSFLQQAASRPISACFEWAAVLAIYKSHKCRCCQRLIFQVMCYNACQKGSSSFITSCAPCESLAT